MVEMTTIGLSRKAAKAAEKWGSGDLKAFKKTVGNHPQVILDLVENEEKHPPRALAIGTTGLSALSSWFLLPSKRKARAELNKKLLDISVKQAMHLTQVLGGINAAKTAISRLEPMSGMKIGAVSDLLVPETLAKWFSRHSLTIIGSHGTSTQASLLQKIASHQKTSPGIKRAAASALETLNARLVPSIAKPKTPARPVRRLR